MSPQGSNLGYIGSVIRTATIKVAAELLLFLAEFSQQEPNRNPTGTRVEMHTLDLVKWSPIVSL
jgi:hypothetical protein